uniref:Shisa N-terminal domain-containing protein n=1 Tax=Gasterosteus aculeatus aculeatus TaxID=481459 RepID=A0AAQ4RNS7_GASAC
MSAACSSYLGADGALVEGFSCPRPGNAIDALFCCGFNDVKYCCDDPNSFFPYEYRYMWWLSGGKSERGFRCCESGLCLRSAGIQKALHEQEVGLRQPAARSRDHVPEVLHNSGHERGKSLIGLLVETGRRAGDGGQSGESAGGQR